MAVPRIRGFGSERGPFWSTIPVTKAVIGLWLLAFLIDHMFIMPVLNWLAFTPFAFPQALTGLLTYPFAIRGMGIFGLLMSGLVFYWFGGSLERSWGPRRFIVFLLATNVAAAILWALGLFLLVRPPFVNAMPVIIVSGSWFMISSVVAAWAWLNPDETILLFFILPMRSRWVGWLTIAGLGLLLPYGVLAGRQPALIPVLGLFALGGVGVAYLYTEYQRKWGWIPRRKKTPQPKQPRLRLSSSSWWARVTRPFREWQRRRRVAHLQRTIKFDD